jgi:hypothetical protein
MEHIASMCDVKSRESHTESLTKLLRLSEREYAMMRVEVATVQVHGENSSNTLISDGHIVILASLSVR